MNRVIVWFLAVHALSLPSFLIGQQRPTKAPKLAKAVPAAIEVDLSPRAKLKPEQKLALEILESSEAAAQGTGSPNAQLCSAADCLEFARS
jgi:hypothetical protein